MYYFLVICFVIVCRSASGTTTSMLLCAECKGKKSIEARGARSETFDQLTSDLTEDVEHIITGLFIMAWLQLSQLYFNCPIL